MNVAVGIIRFPESRRSAGRVVVSVMRTLRYICPGQAALMLLLASPYSLQFRACMQFSCACRALPTDANRSLNFVFVASFIHHVVMHESTTLTLIHEETLHFEQSHI